MNGIWYTTLWDHPLVRVQWAVVMTATLICAVTDIRTRRIPNALTMPLMILGLIWGAWVGGWAGLADAASGLMLLLAPFFILFVFAGGGAGDAKMMGAAGAWLGIQGGLLSLLCVCIAGGVIGLIWTVTHRRTRDVMGNFGWILHVFRRLPGTLVRGRWQEASTMFPTPAMTHPLPYGLAIFVGTLMAMGAAWLWHDVI